MSKKVIRNKIDRGDDGREDKNHGRDTNPRIGKILHVGTTKRMDTSNFSVWTYKR